MDPWGISPVGIIEVCKVVEVEDIKECLYKVIEMSKVLQKKDELPTHSPGKGSPNG